MNLYLLKPKEELNWSGGDKYQSMVVAAKDSDEAVTITPIWYDEWPESPEDIEYKLIGNAVPSINTPQIISVG